MQKKKIFNVYVILELVFGIIGVGFIIPATLLYLLMDKVVASPNSRGNVEILPIIFGVLAATFIGLACLFRYIDMKYQEKYARLYESGRRIWAKVTDVEVNNLVSVNRIHPRNIVCTYEDPESGETYTFRSTNIFGDPSYYLDKEIAVLVDNKNYSCYYVEVEEDKLFPLN